jgi:hypothetical protein
MQRVYAAVATPVAGLLVACSAAVKYGADDPYANCRDLGEIALTSASREDAESRMRARVRELGGDTLLFGMRGRAARLSATPEEIAQRRTELVAVEPITEQAPAVGTTIDALEDSAEPEAADIADGRQRVGRATVQEVLSPPGELWYYGAALRCNLTENRPPG